MGDIFREVDEELKQERYEKLWRTYGKYIVGAAVVLVLTVAGWKIWQSQETARRLAEGDQFNRAVVLLTNLKTADAAKVFSQIGEQTSSGYGILSRFYQASIVSKSGNRIEAIKLYDSIADASSTPPSMRDLATILGALTALQVSSINTKIIINKIQPMSGPGKPYRHIALEILALGAKREGDIEDARSRYREIVDDPAAANGIRSRAAQMLNILGGSS